MSEPQGPGPQTSAPTPQAGGTTAATKPITSAGSTSATRPRLLCKKLHPDARVPTRGSAKAAGYDLYAVGDVVLEVGAVVAVDIGLALQLPAGHVGLLGDRSGLASRGITTRLVNRAAVLEWLAHLPEDQPTPVNLGGVIDEDYRGPVKVLLANVGREPHQFRKGERVTQLLVMRLGDLDAPVDCGDAVLGELTDTARGEGGLGSTGK